MTRGFFSDVELDELRSDCRHGQARFEDIARARLGGEDALWYDDLVVVLPVYACGEDVSAFARVMPADELDPSDLAGDEIAFPLPAGVLLYPKPMFWMGIMGPRLETMAVEVFPNEGTAMFRMTSGGKLRVVVTRIA